MQKNTLFRTVFILMCNRILYPICFFGVGISAHAITLQEAIESASKIDPGMQASKLNQQASMENISMAQSQLLPQISLQGSSSQLTQTTTQEIQSNVSASRSFAGPAINHQLVVRQALIRPKEMSSLRYAKLQAEYMDLKNKYDLSELKTRVISLWIDVLCAQDIAIAYFQPLSKMKMAVQQENAKYLQGEGTRDALLEAEAQFDNANANHIQALETLHAKQKIFQKTTTISPAEISDNITDNINMKNLIAIGKADAWEKFSENSIEFQMLKIQETMQLERVNFAKSSYMPTLDLLAGINAAKNDATSTQGYKYKNKQIGVQYAVHLFEGGNTSASIKYSTLNYEAMLMENEAVKLRIENDFYNNWSQLIISEARLKAVEGLYESSVLSTLAVKRGFQLGLKTIADLASMENLLAKRKVDLINLNQDMLKILTKIKLLSLL